MNLYTVRKATQGLANFILKKGTEGKGVAIAYDSRRMSPEFADEAALCLSANGIKAYVFDSPYNGQSYHHVLDPATGFPADNELASVTILSQSSADGDALSTTCLLLGQEKGMALVESLEGVEALFIAKDGTWTESAGMGDAFAQ